MKKSYFLYRALTKAEVGGAGTHERYIRLPNDFNPKLFFGKSAVQKDTVLDLSFDAHDVTTPSNEEKIQLRYVHYINNKNKEKRIPGLTSLFKKHNVENGDIVCLESRNIDGKISFYISFIKKIFQDSVFFSKVDTNDKLLFVNSISDKKPLQQIFYGAPGTGKSYATNEVVSEYPETIRTTFHPDSDYSTFVGAYKPTSITANKYGLDSVGKTVAIGIEKDTANNIIPFKEKKIEYKFVKQAFLKAYIKAWKFFAQYHITSSISSSKVECVHDQDRWILDSMDDNKIYYTKISTLELAFYERKVKNCWEKILLLDNPDDYIPSTSDRYNATPCIWFKDKYSTDYSADECWKAVIEELNKKNIVAQPGSNQTYTVELKDGSIVITSNYKAWRPTIKGYFDGSKKEDSASIQKLIADVLKEELEKNEELKKSEDVFGAAWEKLKERIGTNKSAISQGSNGLTPQFLVIEEINRGNCAQIFGDIFQLLDRKMGYSEYPIDADEDIRKSLLSKDTDEDPSFGENGLQFTDGQKNSINAIYQKDGTPFRDVAGEIAKGKILVLPPNLHIWATMNTSDQSLFPIDSAFKRRWDWKYIPISEGKEKWSIVVKDKEYDWWTFLKKMNSIVGEATMSEDKKMGFYFCKADDKKCINAETFVSKVMFYLWNDVFKDNGLDWKNEKGEPIFKYKVKDNDGNEKEEDMVFSTFFKEDGTANEDQVERLMINMLINPIAKPQQPSASTQDAKTESEAETGIETEQATDTETETETEI